MTEVKRPWSVGQGLLTPFAWAFTKAGHRHFAEWITALALNVEEHTITQSVLAIERPEDWKALADQVQVARRTVSRAGPGVQGPAPGCLRWGLRAAERGPAAGRTRGWVAPHRVPHAVELTGLQMVELFCARFRQYYLFLETRG